jgi:predicted lysophospholipase L1 biosynthesis ABC-type transport system permease subunit
MIAMATLSASVLTAHLLLPRWWALGAGLAITLGFGLYCLRRLIHETGFSRRLRRGKAV